MTNKNPINSFFNYIETTPTRYSLSGKQVSSRATERALAALTLDFPDNEDLYIKLIHLQRQRRAYNEALQVINRIPEKAMTTPSLLLLSLEIFVRLGRFTEANTFYNNKVKAQPGLQIRVEDSLSFLVMAMESNEFDKLTGKDFGDLFFIENLVTQTMTSVFDVARHLTVHFSQDLISAAHNYVSRKGGKFIYVSIDDLFMVENRTEHEQSILSSGVSSGQVGNVNRIDWLKSCPKHIKEGLQGIPDFDDNPQGYTKVIFDGPSHTVIGTRVVMQNYSSPYVNVENNMRRTVYTPQKYDHKILMVGPSDIYGFGCEDKHTIASFLQQKIVRDNNISNYYVENHGLRGNPLPVCLNNIFQKRINPGDFVILFGYSMIDPDSEIANEVDYLHQNFSRPHDLGEIFFDHAHVNWKGNEFIANNIFERFFKTKIEKPALADVPKIISTEYVNGATQSAELIKYLFYRHAFKVNEQNGLNEYREYLQGCKTHSGGTVGSIAVNCNPMTLGHLHLIEHASKKVDHLYLFVIEEDMSFFSFSDRYQIVKGGTSHLDNVKVIRGGRYICTEFTYPEYFTKETEAQVNADASLEAWIFCEYIAPALDISIIFLGDEPKCRITRQYNKTMQNILPEYAIDVSIIPRIGFHGTEISASTVRKYLSEKKFENIKKIVPTVTYDFLIRNFN